MVASSWGAAAGRSASAGASTTAFRATGRRPRPLGDHELRGGRGARTERAAGRASGSSAAPPARDRARDALAASLGSSAVEVTVCDVGPRDGLQNEPEVVPPETRAELVERLAATGVPRIEAVSFVRADRVPQMADAEEVVARVS